MRLVTTLVQHSCQYRFVCLLIVLQNCSLRSEKMEELDKTAVWSGSAYLRLWGSLLDGIQPLHFYVFCLSFPPVVLPAGSRHSFNSYPL